MSVAANALRRGLTLTDDSGYELQSSAGREVQSQWTRGQRFLQGSANDWQPVIEPALLRIREECAAPGWDGEGSVPVLPKTILRAARLAEQLAGIVPIGTAPPDVVPESDGDISFSWHADGDRVYAVSLGVHDRLNFAGQFAERGSVHGWQPLRFESPRVLRESLGEIARHVARLTSGVS